MFSGSKLEVRASIHGLCRQHPAPCWVAPALQLRGTRSARALTARGRGRLLGALCLVVFLHVSGDFRHGTTPHSWIVYKGKSYGKMDDLGVPQKFMETPCIHRTKMKCRHQKIPPSNKYQPRVAGEFTVNFPVHVLDVFIACHWVVLNKSWGDRSRKRLSGITRKIWALCSKRNKSASAR